MNRSLSQFKATREGWELITEGIFCYQTDWPVTGGLKSGILRYAITDWEVRIEKNFAQDLECTDRGHSARIKTFGFWPASGPLARL